MENASVLRDLLKEYDKRQANAIYEMENRKKELFSKIPRLQEIENELNSYAIECAKSILSTNCSEAVTNLEKKANVLKEERDSILKKEGKDLHFENKERERKYNIIIRDGDEI